MNNAPKTVLCLHDLSCLGRAGLAVILPVLSAMGVQPVALPTAVLSTHTGGLGVPARMNDITYLPAALTHYKKLGLRFDALYTGYLTDPAQARLAEQAMRWWPDALLVVDPVLGDNGALYSGVTPELIAAQRSLCARADVIVPNLTEACVLLGAAPADATPDGAAALAQKLLSLCKNVVITGVPDGRYIGCAGAGRDGALWFVRQPRIPRSYPGTGDIFAAALTGHLLCGNVPEAAAGRAAKFVRQCIEATPEKADARLGVWLEAALPQVAFEDEDAV